MEDQKEQFVKKIEELSDKHTKNVIKHCNREFIKFFNEAAKIYNEYNYDLREKVDEEKNG